MAHICFLTYYDLICIGPRLLSSALKENGHKASLVIFKGEKYDEPISEEREDLKCYSYFREGIYRGSLYDIDGWTEEDENRLIELLRDIRPDILAISTRTFWAELGNQLSHRIRTNFPDMQMVAGGWGPSLEPEKFLEYCDYVFFGEGDTVILDIADAYDRNKNLKELRNVIYLDNGKLVRNEVYGPIEDLDALPFPDFDVEDKYLIGNGKVQEGHEFYNKKIYDVFAGRGCPMNCSYCMSSMWRKLYKDEYDTSCKKQRWRSVDRVLEEIEIAKQNGAKLIKIKDEVFPISKNWIREFIPKYKERIGLPFFGYLRPEWHNREIIQELYDAGLRCSMVGIQSGSEHMRKNVYNRRFKKEDLVEFVNALDEFALNLEYHLIGFCPIEEERYMEETLNFLYTLPYGQLKIFRIILFPKAPLTGLIGEKKQSKEKDKLDAWYAHLYTMALKDASWRELARTIHKTKMFKESPGVLANLFCDEYKREQEQLEDVLKDWGGRSLSIPKSLSVSDQGKELGNKQV